MHLVLFIDRRQRTFTVALPVSPTVADTWTIREASNEIVYDRVEMRPQSYGRYFVYVER